MRLLFAILLAMFFIGCTATPTDNECQYRVKSNSIHFSGTKPFLNWQTVGTYFQIWDHVLDPQKEYVFHEVLLMDAPDNNLRGFVDHDIVPILGQRRINVDKGKLYMIYSNADKFSGPHGGFNCNGNKEIKYVDLSNVTFHLTAVF